MGWTTPTIRATGDLITAAIWNGEVVNDVKYLGLWDALTASPPGSPTNGQPWIYDPGTGVHWYFKYNSGLVASFPWEAVGEQWPLLDDYTANEWRTASGFGRLQTTRQITVPRSGFYRIRYGGSWAIQGKASGSTQNIGVNAFLNGSFASGLDPISREIQVEDVAVGHTLKGTFTGETGLLTLTAADTVELGFNMSYTDSSDEITNRWLRLDPFRVS